MGVAWQETSDFHLRVPPIDNVEADVLTNCTQYSRCGLPSSVLAALHAPDALTGISNIDLYASLPQAGR